MAPEPVRLFVFSHPNHELAVFGIARRWKPHLVFLTDGGGPDRVADTKHGLERLGLLDRARFLNHSEASFYKAILDRDTAFYDRVAAQVRETVAAVRPTQVYCDAVEFYNPVHDICLPVVKAALRDSPGVEVFEIPLIHQQPAEDESYQIQRAAAGKTVEVKLSDEEASAKCSARDEVYGCLREQMGPVLATVSKEHLSVEQVAPAVRALPRPDAGRVLRYEWRGELLRKRGEIERVITYAGHYAPVAERLFS